MTRHPSGVCKHPTTQRTPDMAFWNRKKPAPVVQRLDVKEGDTLIVMLPNLTREVALTAHEEISAQLPGVRVLILQLDAEVALVSR